MSCVTLLGTKGGPAIRPGTRMPTSSLVRMAGLTVLVDAGLGATRGVCDAGVPLTGLDAIVVTHLHSDHCLELGPLLHTAWTAGLTRPVPIWGPAGLADYWQGFLASMAYDIPLRERDEGRPPFAPMADLRVLGEDGFTLGPLTLRAMRNVHPPVEDSLALRFDGPDGSVVFSGDTAPMAGMEDFARGADLLVHEAMLTAGIDALCARVGNGDDRLKRHLLRSHTPAEEAGRIAAAAGVQALALHHLVPCDDPDFTEADWRREATRHFAGPVHVGTDGMTLDLAEGGS
ncbi:MBL fold metallo-hydrolase [Wenxinia marina]|uniref:Metal-dependent hydrolase of the beta-lactamase superfamily III n=1 Tax=Wenxinia marina DSM 24838 TaxID=1123501 RepID=A0A0D0QCJ8_9RHOB|nr:MBL fold metallo-hydrolase [Wenxinia marina]KIQ70052.1 Metal-dependent hydrolase of the beta-lactamase superfamily III [Wenxinia marina DSM 24838]GGL63165.1 hydrolase [Wenxinia marina]